MSNMILVEKKIKVILVEKKI